MKKFVVVDIETTGHSPKNGDRIIQFAAVTIIDGMITNTYSTYINPEIPIPPFITELTGIHDEDVASAPIFYEVAEEIFRILDGHAFVAHNAHFDWNFLQEELNLNGFPNVKCPIIDTVEMTRILMPTLDSFRLQDIAEYAGLQHDRPHQADSDALVTAHWFLTLLEKAGALPFATLRQLQRLARGLKTDLAAIFQSLAHKKSGEAESLPETWSEYKGLVIRKYDVRSDDDNSTAGESSKSLDTVLEKLIREAPDREKLYDMVEHVYTSLERRECSLIETDPQFNKTAGYLIPALVFSRKQQKTVVISTHSTGQQLALIEREIPEISRRIQIPVVARLLKGKSHYLDLQKFIAVLKEEEEHYDETMTKMQILVWLLETTSGDKSELNLSSGGELFWKRINAAGVRNHEKQDATDFYERALAQARKANIIVTNHHFLMYHLTTRDVALPEFDYLIIDEAHQFERDVARYFGNTMSFQKLKFLLGRIGSREQPRILWQLFALNKKRKLHFTLSSEQLEERLYDFSEKIDEFFQLASSLMQHSGKNTMPCDFTKEPQLGYSWERLYESFRNLFMALEDIYWRIEEKFLVLTTKERLLLDDLAILLQEIQTIERMHRDLFEKQRGQIVWMDRNGPSLASVRLFSQPVFIGNYLKDVLYSRLKTVIFVSNTLTIKHSFAFIQDELGLGDYPVVTKQITADTNPDKTKVYSMIDIPDIKEVDGEEFIQTIARHIATIAEVVQGRLLVLFTSREMLQKTWQEVKEVATLDDYVLLAQGVSSGSPRRLLKQFTRFQKTILFGANVFWDGLDLKEADLDALIVARLPFLPPDHPVHRGKTKRLKTAGKNPFYNYSVPVAVLRFKQGFNHLLANENKKRLFIIMDQRVYTKSYGDYFLKSIPVRDVEKLTLPELYVSLQKNVNE